MTTPSPARRRRRRWLLGLLLLAVPIVVVVAALPWALGTPPARRWLLARANRVLAPGGLDVASFRFSWFGPTRMTGFAIRDPQGDRVAFAPLAVWDRNLLRILFDRPRYGMLRLDRGTLDVERRADGSIDLYEALKPILNANPATDLTVVVRQATFRFRDPGLAEPLTAGSTALTIHRRPAPEPLTWDLQLADTASQGPEAPRLDLAGSFDRWHAGPPALSATLTVHRWPLAIAAAGLVTRTRISGQARLDRAAGLWRTSGKAEALAVDSTGPMLRGDRLRLDRIETTWTVNQAEGSRTGYEFTLKSPVGWLNGRGDWPDRSGTTRMNGELDLADLARRLPHALRIREGWTLDRGSATLRVASVRGKVRGWDAEAMVSDLVARHDDRVVTLHDPATVSARLLGDLHAPRLDHLAVKTPFLDVLGRGDPDQGVTVTGTFDLAGLRRQLGALIDFGGLDLAGQGTLKADYHRTKGEFLGQLAADVHQLRIDGPATFQRDQAQLTASIRGPSTTSGLPGGWSQARVGLTSGGLALDLSAVPGGETLRLDATASARLADGRAEGHMVGQWGHDLLDINEVRLIARPVDPAKPDAALTLTGRGRFDPTAGSLTLEPLPGAPSGAVALAPEGLRVVGIGRDGLRADLALAGDLGASARALAAWTGREPVELEGSWGSRWSVRGGDGLQFAGRVEVLGLVSDPAGAPVALDLRGAYRIDPDRIDLTEFVLASPYATLEASGRVDDPGGRRLAEIEGRLSPDWKALNAMLRRRVEPGARIDGRPGAVHLRGPLTAGAPDALPEGIDAGLGFELTGLDLYGMKLGPTPIAATFQEGHLAIEPIRASLNGGTVRLDPAIVRDESGGLVLRFQPGSAIDDAQVNDEVSRRVLAFAAPVLRDATKVHGRVSARIDRADFPVGANLDRKAVVEGRVVFQDVAFVPGPLSRDLLSLIGREDATLDLNEPIFLSIADGRIHQRGLAIPIGRLARIELDGSVGFDRTLDMKARLPITPSLAANRPVFGGLMDGVGLTVPIGGTLSEPKIDRDALRLGLRDLGQDVLRRGAALGGMELLDRLARPRDPNAPPRLTPRERKAQRLDRRARRRGLVP